MGRLGQIRKEAGKNYASIEKPDDLQSIANLIRFFFIFEQCDKLEVVNYSLPQRNVPFPTNSA